MSGIHNAGTLNINDSGSIYIYGSKCGITGKEPVKDTQNAEDQDQDQDQHLAPISKNIYNDLKLDALPLNLSYSTIEKIAFAGSGKYCYLLKKFNDHSFYLRDSDEKELKLESSNVQDITFMNGQYVVVDNFENQLQINYYDADLEYKSTIVKQYPNQFTIESKIRGDILISRIQNGNNSSLYAYDMTKASLPLIAEHHGLQDVVSYTAHNNEIYYLCKQADSLYIVFKGGSELYPTINRELTHMRDMAVHGEHVYICCSTISESWSIGDPNVEKYNPTLVIVDTSAVFVDFKDFNGQYTGNDTFLTHCLPMEGGVMFCGYKNGTPGHADGQRNDLVICGTALYDSNTHIVGVNHAVHKFEPEAVNFSIRDVICQGNNLLMCGHTTITGQSNSYEGKIFYHEAQS